MAERKHVGHFPLVSIITLNYEQAGVTNDFLRSARELTYPNYEIIVVDNGSKQYPFGPRQAAQHPGVTLISSSVNLGFAGGNNLAMRQARGEYFLLVNNDTILTPNLIEQLLEPFRSDAAVGVVCPKIRFAHDRSVIQYAGYRPLNAYTGTTTAIGSREADHGQYDQPGQTPFAHGAAMMISRAVTEHVGLMSEAYFLYYEELDWSHRIRQGGYTIYYQASALIYHKESISIGRTNPQKVFYLTRNRIWFMRACTSRPQFLVFALYFILIALPKNLSVYMVRGQFHHLRAYLRGVRSSLSAAPVPAPVPHSSTLTKPVPDYAHWH